MLGFKKRRQEKYLERLRARADTWKMGLWNRLQNNATTLFPDAEKSPHTPIIIGGIINWVFGFGDYGPKIKEFPHLRVPIDTKLGEISKRIFDEDMKVEMTAAVIIAAAAQTVPMERYKSHFDKLLSLGIVMEHINIPLIDQMLRNEHKPYYYYMQYRGI